MNNGNYCLMDAVIRNLRRRGCNPSMLRTWPRGLRECCPAQEEALLLTSSPAHGSTPIKNWSGQLPIGSGLARGLYRCHSRCGEFSPQGPSSSPALLSPGIRLRSCGATISLPPIVPVYRAWTSRRRKSKRSYLQSWTGVERRNTRSIAGPAEPRRSRCRRPSGARALTDIAVGEVAAPLAGALEGLLARVSRIPAPASTGVELEIEQRRGIVAEDRALHRPGRFR